MTNSIVVRQHFEEVATRWWRRAPTYLVSGRTLFPELVSFDETIDAHLDGLNEAGKTGLDCALSALRHDTPDAAADIFAALALTLYQEDQDAFFHVVNISSTFPQFPTALNGALAWVGTSTVKELIEWQLTQNDPIYADAALAQCHTHDLTGGDCLKLALDTGDPRSISRAFKTAGECGRIDLLPAIRTWLTSDGETHPASTFYAAWAGVILGKIPQAIRILGLACAQPHPFRHEATKLLSIALSAEHLQPLLKPIFDSANTYPLAIKAAGWSGNPDYVPWLLEKLDDASLAGLAGESIRMITGFGCELADFDSTAPGIESSAEIDTHPPRPSTLARERTVKWWDDHRNDFRNSPRFLLGRPIEIEWINTLLVEGEQAYRELAALHRIILLPGSKLLPTQANANIQWQRILQLLDITP